jgi:hypothetical protein
MLKRIVNYLGTTFIKARYGTIIIPVALCAGTGRELPVPVLTHFDISHKRSLE